MSNHTTVRDAFFSLHNQSSALGTYSIQGGDITITNANRSVTPFVLERLKAASLVQIG